MDTAYLILLENHNGTELYITSENIVRKKKISSNVKYRISPIFPVVPSGFWLPEPTSDYKVALFTPDNAFQAIGNVITEVQASLSKKLWFSYGLPSLVIISQNDNDWKIIKEKLGVCRITSHSFSIFGHFISGDLIF